MAYFNHAFCKVFLGTLDTQASVPVTSVGVDEGFITEDGVPSVSLIDTAAPFALGLGAFGLFNPETWLSVDAASFEVTSGQNLVLASTALYQNDKVGPFHGGYQETTKSKKINPRYVSRVYRVDDVAPVNAIISAGQTSNNGCPCPEFYCDQTYKLRLDVKGSPTLRFLNHNAYETLAAYTGCCAGPVP